MFGCFLFSNNQVTWKQVSLPPFLTFRALTQFPLTLNFTPSWAGMKHACTLFGNLKVEQCMLFRSRPNPSCSNWSHERTLSARLGARCFQGPRGCPRLSPESCSCALQSISLPAIPLLGRPAQTPLLSQLNSYLLYTYFTAPLMSIDSFLICVSEGHCLYHFHLYLCH